MYSVNCHFTTESPLPSFSLMKQPFSELLMIHHNRCSHTYTVRMPSGKLEIFRILPRLCITHRTRPVIRRRTLHLYTSHKIHILPTLVVGSTKRFICFRRSQAKSIFIRRAINTLPRMIIFHRLGWDQFAIRVPYTAETTVGFV